MSSAQTSHCRWYGLWTFPFKIDIYNSEPSRTPQLHSPIHPLNQSNNASLILCQLRGISCFSIVVTSLCCCMDVTEKSVADMIFLRCLCGWRRFQGERDGSTNSLHLLHYKLISHSLDTSYQHKLRILLCKHMFYTTHILFTTALRYIISFSLGLCMYEECE